MVRPIHAYGDGLLREKCPPADAREGRRHLLDGLIGDLLETMESAGGLGLSAPQVGRLVRVFVANVDGERRAFVNPVITVSHGEDVEGEEGCLSIPGVSVGVRRPPEVAVKYLDRDLRRRHEAFVGTPARVVQHEMDHLDGRLITDYIRPLDRRMVGSQLDRISAGKVEVGYPMRFNR